MGNTTPRIGAGRNIALKAPAREFDRIVAFYRDAVGLPVLRDDETSVTFEFGAMRLWIDRVPALSQAELWLELETDDLEEASARLAAAGAARCDEIEPLPADLTAGWIAAPGGVVHLLAETVG